MTEQKETIETFYNLSVKDVLNKRHWDLPLIEKNAELSTVLAVLGGIDHVWVVDSLENKKLLGVITEGDVLKALAPKRKITYF
ncbi:MAG: CBS domain-containing protein, partial [Candidatus Thermoplasmatota archaeon]